VSSGAAESRPRPAHAGGLRPRPHCGSRVRFEKPGRTGRAQPRPQQMTHHGERSPLQASLSTLLSPCLSSCARSVILRPSPPGPPGSFREGSKKVPVQLTELNCCAQATETTRPPHKRSRVQAASVEGVYCPAVCPVCLRPVARIDCFPETSGKIPITDVTGQRCPVRTQLV
jgi:hypothetical protein